MAQKRPDRAHGARHDEFWDWCNKGELRLQRCQSCGNLSCPPVQACEHCNGTQFAWERMSGRGKVVSWCAFERDYYRGLLPIPWETILVELEEKVLFISNPGNFALKDVSAGMPVKVGFAECEDSAGPFKLPIFDKV